MPNPQKVKVLFVCLGNICRSPMAEAIFLNLVKQNGLGEKLSADSAGTSAHHEGGNYHPETIRVVKKHGLEISGRSRPVEREDFSKFDYIVVMDTANYRDIMAMHPAAEQKHKISHMLEYSQHDYIAGLDVPDPYYGGGDGFERIFQLLSDACAGLFAKIIEENPGLDSAALAQRK